MSYLFAFNGGKKNKDSERRKQKKNFILDGARDFKNVLWSSGKEVPHTPSIQRVDSSSTPYHQTPAVHTQPKDGNHHTKPHQDAKVLNTPHQNTTGGNVVPSTPSTQQSISRPSAALSPSADATSFDNYQRLLLMQQIDNFSMHAAKLPEPEVDNKNLTSNYFKNKFQTVEQKHKENTAMSLDQSILKRIEARMNDPNDYQDFMDVVEEDDKTELLEKRLLPISEADKAKIKAVLNGPANSSVVIDKFNIDMTRQKIVCLKPGTWLNDEVVNFYMAMLLDRDSRLCEVSKQQGKVRLPSYFFNSFFVSKLLEGGKYDYTKVKRWTKKFDVFAQDKIFFPVNLNNTHWTMAVVFLTKKEIHYYDSMNGTGRHYMDALLRWVADESNEKRKIAIDKSEWKLISNEDNVPQQRNGFDCGMFSIMCADYLADNLPFGHKQDQMSENRLKVGAAILNGTLPY